MEEEKEDFGKQDVTNVFQISLLCIRSAGVQASVRAAVATKRLIQLDLYIVFG